MKFRDALTYAWTIPVVIFIAESLRWWFGADPNWDKAIDLSAWTWAVLLVILMSHRDEEAQARAAELERWRRAWLDHDRWLGEFSDVELVLSNLKAQADGKELSVVWPPGAHGPWAVSRLQEVLRQRARAAVPGLSG